MSGKRTRLVTCAALVMVGGLLACGCSRQSERQARQNVADDGLHQNHAAVQQADVAEARSTRDETGSSHNNAQLVH